MNAWLLSWKKRGNLRGVLLALLGNITVQRQFIVNNAKCLTENIESVRSKCPVQLPLMEGNSKRFPNKFFGMRDFPFI